MKNRRKLTRWIGGGALVVVVLLLVSGRGFAQTETPAAGPTLVELQTRLKHAQSETELDPKVKQEVIETYQAAIERLEIADEAAVKTKQFEQRASAVPEEMQRVRHALDLLPEQSTFVVAAQDDIDTLERKLAERRRQIQEPDSGLRGRLDAIKKELAGRKTRLEEITRDLAELDERLDTIQKLMDEPAPDNQPRELTNAIQSLLETRRMRANEERAALRAEQAWCQSDEAANLLRAGRDLAARELALAEAEVQMLQDAVDKRRGSEADQRVHAAEQTVARTPPRIKPVAEANLALAEESRDLAAALRETNQLLDTARDNFNTLKAEFDQSRNMVEVVGLTESIGLLLRQQRGKLSDTRGLHSRLALRGETVRQSRMRMFQIEAEIAALQDLEAAATKAAVELADEEPAADSGANAKPAAPDAKSAAPDAKSNIFDAAAVRQLAGEIKPLLELRRGLLEGLNADHASQFQKLVLLDNDERKLLAATQQYAEYIDERVLWIRTGTLFGSSQAARVVAGFGWLCDGTNWLKVRDALLVNFQREPLPYAVTLVALLLWAGLRWPLRRRLRLLGTTAAAESCREIFPTMQAVALTVLLAAVVPAGLAFIGWRLDHCASTSRFVHAFAMGLFRAATFAAPLELLRLMVTRGGLAEQHLDWSAVTLRRIRRHVTWFVPAGIVLVGLVGMVEATADDQRLDSLGRLGYLVFAGLVAVFCQRTFPRTAPIASFDRAASANPPVQSREQPRMEPRVEPRVEQRDARRAGEAGSEDDVWLNRLTRLGGVLAVTVPLGLLIVCWSGYFYTALQLTWRLQASAWLAVALVLLRGTVQRWLVLERRRMAVLQAEELQAIADAGRQPGSDSHSPFLFPRWTWPDFRLNLTQIVTQVRSLLDTGLLTLAAVGLWFVWADVTPALNILDRVTLWQTTVDEVVPVKGGDDKAAVQIVQRPKAITAASLGMAVLVMLIAVVAGRNIPGLVEVILLEHLSVDAGIRFASTCLVRYVIFITGVVLAFNQIGVGWNSVQWLVAAASVGLGFGLQEIFANFVSGIILLFERPMRVGDVVTIGSTTGTVSRIRFRATTIVDGDRKELIVPNKSFITGNLLNWTLSDSINRIAVRVGVAYGSDPGRVRELLLKIASEHPALLKNPAPSATLEVLGDSALQFELKAFLPNLKDRLQTTHELNAMIHDRFRTAGIDIPFPQQEVSVNIRSQVPLNEIRSHAEAQSSQRFPELFYSANSAPLRETSSVE